VFCLVIGVIVFRHDGHFGGTLSLFAAIAAASLAVSFLAPERLLPIYRVFVVVAFPIGWVLSHLILALIFYAVFTPIGLAMRLLGRDPMHRKWDPDAKSYWVPHKAKNKREDYFRQF
jgi:hypothetical protein